MNQQAKKGIELFLQALSVDTKVPEMEKTPARVAELYEELFSGIGKNTADMWGDVFPTEYTGLVAITDIPFFSICEHHMMPFFGTVDVIYQPGQGRVAGLSKFKDVIDVLSRKPQLQERLTSDIADTVEHDLIAEGVFVRVKATQLCMLIKRTMQQGSQVVTMESRGVLRESGPIRDEAIAILGGVQADV